MRGGWYPCLAIPRYCSLCHPRVRVSGLITQQRESVTKAYQDLSAKRANLSQQKWGKWKPPMVIAAEVVTTVVGPTRETSSRGSGLLQGTEVWPPGWAQEERRHSVSRLNMCRQPPPLRDSISHGADSNSQEAQGVPLMKSHLFNKSYLIWLKT